MRAKYVKRLDINLFKQIMTKKSDIKLLLLDVDGTLTDGGIYLSASGDEFKKFNSKDGARLKIN